jgi:hypothetical protein
MVVMGVSRAVVRPSVLDRLVGPALSALAIFPSFIWILLDRRLWPWDQAWYGEATADLYATLVNHPEQWFDAMRKAIGAKPPLLAWVGQFLMPLGYWLGNVDSVLLLVPLLSHAATLWVVWLTVRRMVPGQTWAAVSAVLMLASAPLFVGMSHQYLVEAPQSLVVAASFLLALTARDNSLFRLGAFLVVVCMAGMATKTTTPLYCGLAWGIAGLVLLLRLRRGEKPVLSGWRDNVIGLAAAVLAVLTISWYATNVLPMLEHIRNATLSDLALPYGSQGPFITKLSWWIKQLNGATFLLPYLATTSLVAILYSAFALWRVASHATSLVAAFKQLILSQWVTTAAVLHVLMVLTVLSLQVNEETRFLEPMLPVFVSVVTWALAQLSLIWVFPLVSLALLVQLIGVQLEAHGRIGRESTSAWLLPLDTTSNDRRVADALVQATCPKPLQYRYVVVGPERQSMNANSLAMYAARMAAMAGYRCYYTSLGYAEVDPKRALDRIDNLNASYVILPKAEDIESDPNFLNTILRPVHANISRSNRYNREQGEFGTYQIYRRSE